MTPTFENLPLAVDRLGREIESLKAIILAQQPATQRDEIMTIEDASEFIRLAKPTVYALVSNRQIPFSKKGKRLYFRRSELERWVTSGRRATTAEIEASV